MPGAFEFLTDVLLEAAGAAVAVPVAAIGIAVAATSPAVRGRARSFAVKGMARALAARDATASQFSRMGANPRAAAAGLASGVIGAAAGAWEECEDLLAEARAVQTRWRHPHPAENAAQAERESSAPEPVADRAPTAEQGGGRSDAPHEVAGPPAAESPAPRRPSRRRRNGNGRTAGERQAARKTRPRQTRAKKEK